MNGREGLKKPKREIESMEEDQEQQNPEKSCRADDNDSEGISGRDEEEALVALIEHRTKEVEHLRNRISYYQSQLGEAERRLEHSQNKLVHVRRKISDKLWNHSVPVARKEVKLKNASSSPIQTSEGSTQRRPQSKPPLVISNPNPKSSRASSVTETGSRAPPSSSDSLMKARADQHQKTPSEPKDTKSQIVGAKRKPERREHQELVSMVRSRPSPSLIHCNASTHISSQHKRKLRSLSICPVNEQLFITSALDGRVNLWQIQAKGTPERQLRLFDIRLRKSELHAFGWKQESSESQSALINQAWSPDGLYLTSGSADPMIHIFDIRYNSHKPSQSVQAHQKRVFKAEWHYSLPLLISISSDLNIGLHKI
ncbi:hypothetical protein Cgig2_005994 [Carnegiea gigantea]|uniref:Uncharacterized protein n=1 Tax=Carnegiea gigantea TaxID=171969 RepID=A0A9Q1QS68_9CARY|nr:hypothetical protein Cgig2_005994 [Carnegiea gigantea]